MRSALFPAALALAAMLGCSESSSESASADSSAPADTSWLLDDRPDGAIDIAYAKSAVAEGDEIVLRGVIGGRVNAMSHDIATFVMMDANLDNPCVTADDDHCQTPWDYCCTPPETRLAGSATVQVVDAAGAPLMIDLGEHGVAPLDTVVVVGSVAPRPSDEVLVVRASKLYRVPG